MSDRQISERFLAAWPKEITFSTGESEGTNRYIRRGLSREKFIAHVTNHREGKKEGSAWSPFHYEEDKRQGANCVRADVLALDIDDGTSEAEIVRTLRRHTQAALVVSSYSHLSTRTDFKKDEYDAWQKTDEDANDEDFMRTRDKDYREVVWRGSTIARGDDGEPAVKRLREKGETVKKITVEHAPCPKFRIIVPLASPFRVADYNSAAEAANAWRHMCLALAEDLGLTTDPKTLLLTQLFYDPRHWAGVEPVMRRVSGWPFDAAAALARALDAARVSGSWDRAKLRPAASTAPRSSSAGKVFRGDMAVLRDAVMAITHDERIDMNTWIAIIGAIYDESDGSNEGNELAHEWSATWVKGYQEDETENVWRRAARNYGKNTTKATGATIRLRAINDGWTPPDGWTWPDGWTREIIMTDERNQQELVDSFNEEFAVIQNKGSARILREGKDATGLDTFDLLPERDFRLLTMNRGNVTTADARGKPKERPVGEYWLKSPQRRDYRGLVFHPGEELRSDPGSNGPPAFYNLWRGWGVKPSRKGSCHLFGEHLLENVCGDDLNHFKWLMDWMAHIFQKPREKPGVAVVLRGKKGTGKSLVGKTLGVLVGAHHYFVASQQEQLLGKFNAPLASALLIQAEEAFFSHDPKVWGILKDLITRETRTIEPKGVDAFMVEAYDRLIITSNESAAVPAEPGERRYAVFDVGDKHARDTAYFKAISDELNAGGYARLLYELLQRDLHDFDCRSAPETPALAEQKLNNLRPVARWMLARLQESWFWTFRDNEERQFDFEGANRRDAPQGGDAPNERIGKDTVRSNYIKYCRQMSDGHPMDERELGKWLVENAGFRPAQRRCKAERRDGNVVRRKGEREHCYRIPPLAEVRERFIKSFELPPTIFDEPDGDSE